MRPVNNLHHHHHHHHQEQRIINGPRPAPLKVSKESHLIHKMSSSSSLVASVSTDPAAMDGGGAKQQQQQQQQRSHPVIIYTHSPKVIHTQPRDFMALVQKLTGNSSNSLGKNTTKAPTHEEQGRDDHDDDPKAAGSKSRPDEDIESPILNPPRIASFADIPLFTPNSSNLFCSPGPVNRFPDSFSPSVFDFFKGQPE